MLNKILIATEFSQLSTNEKELIEIIRSTKCAHIDVYVQDYTPLRIEKIKEGIILGSKKNN